MITRFRLADFKGHRDTDLALERFTILVGDNGSGKTSVLEALHLQGAIVPDPVAVLRGDLAPDDLRRRGASGPIKVTSTGLLRQAPWRSELIIEPGDNRWNVVLTNEGPGPSFYADAFVVAGGGGGSRNEGAWNIIRASTRTARFYRFESSKIAASAYSDLPDTPIEPDGAQTAEALAALKLSDDEAFARIEDAMRRLVPSLERVRIRQAEVVRPSRGDTVKGSKLFLDFRGSPGIPAHHASQGTLIMLALLTVLHRRDRPDLLLLDDIEHALHPRAQMELVRMIKGLLELDDFKETQVIATTHSPYVLDELAPENVIAFALRDDGTVTSKSLSEHPDTARMKGALRTGQLWSIDAERDWVLK